MTARDDDEGDLVQFITALPDQNVSDFIREQSRSKLLSGTVRSLNEAVLSHEAHRRGAALKAIEKLGFL